MNKIVHKAESRGSADHGWLKVNHSFSFANYHNPERMQFGALRVLNDDCIAGLRGFPEHPHDNMEIITIPLEGDLAHADNMGNSSIIKAGDIQVMSAGTGIFHSEKNPNKDQAVKLLQIWITPNKKDVEPRYDQLSIADLESSGLKQILSPCPCDEGVWIHQDAWIHMGDFDAGQAVEYMIRKPGNGIYAFVINGSLTINGQEIKQRDGLGIWDLELIEIESITASKLLLIEVPMDVI